MESHLRLRSIKYKDGCELKVLHTQQADLDYKIVMSGVRRVMNGHSSDYKGYAFVVWGKDGSSTCDAQSDSDIPSILIPDFVRNRLLAEKIEEWTIRTLDKR